MPLSSSETSGRSQTQRRPHSTGDSGRQTAAGTQLSRSRCAAAQSAATSGVGRASWPPRSGSITTTPSPLSAASSSPRVPAWYSSSM